jgi:hypothetical protein
MSPEQVGSVVDLRKLASNAFAEMIENKVSSKESIMSYFPGMQKGNLDSVKSDAHGKVKKETVTLQGVSVTRVTFDVSANVRSGIVKGFGRRPIATVRQALRPSSESVQGRNPRGVEAGGMPPRPMAI